MYMKTFLLTLTAFALSVFSGSRALAQSENIQYSVGVGFEKANFESSPKKKDFINTTTVSTGSPSAIATIDYRKGRKKNLHLEGKGSVSVGGAQADTRVTQYSVGESGIGYRVDASKRMNFSEKSGHFGMVSGSVGTSFPNRNTDPDNRVLVGPAVIVHNFKDVTRTRSIAGGVSGQLERETANGILNVNALAGINVITKMDRDQDSGTAQWTDSKRRGFNGGGVAKLDASYSVDLPRHRSISNLTVKAGYSFMKQREAEEYRGPTNERNHQEIFSVSISGALK
jgi:hypothetical protein